MDTPISSMIGMERPSPLPVADLKSWGIGADVTPTVAHAGLVVPFLHRLERTASSGPVWSAPCTQVDGAV